MLYRYNKMDWKFKADFFLMKAFWDKKKFYGASGSRQCSEHTNLKSIEATGKSSTNYVNTKTMSFSGPDQTSIKSALVRCRGNGCVAPKKKGAI